MPTAACKDAPLSRAIDTADASILRNILHTMCNDSKICRKQAEKRMLTSKKHNIVAAQKPKLIPRFEKCKNCFGMFDITKNNKQACRSHPGYLNIDEDFFREVFPDDDQVIFAIDSIDPYFDWRQDDFPEAFFYDCCYEDCNSEGCRVRRHVPERKSKRS
ncbi:hypothetical protein GGR57DRAFT_508078 [Xylariaceae sp. FL1272]|nr:hypothetical protein GGR57DRAFT_508078 [Xylariaceae sp. FL1272]